jgi:predicted lipoprotein with Yx(FWY)xxD motif
MIRWTCVLCALIALAFAGCGSDESSSSTDAGNSTTSRDTTSAPTADDPSSTSDGPEKGAWGVAFGAEGEELGLILYDLSGHTLYTFSKDKGGKSSCYGACAKKWPPALTEERPEARGGAVASKVGAMKRNDGTRQLTYAGHPLYTFSGDRSAEVNGNGVTAFGGEWHAIRPNGEAP